MKPKHILKQYFSPCHGLTSNANVHNPAAGAANVTNEKTVTLKKSKQLTKAIT